MFFKINLKISRFNTIFFEISCFSMSGYANVPEGNTSDGIKCPKLAQYVNLLLQVV